MTSRAAKFTSCGVLVTDGKRLLLGRAPLSPRWDIPKGIAEPGEALAAAARRELREETGIEAPEAELRPLGVFSYLPAKALVCTSYFFWKGRRLPEFDRFGVFARDEALLLVGKSMARVLAGIPLAGLCGASM